MLPDPVQIDELLRHFWALIPVNTEEKKAKFIRIQVRPVGILLFCQLRF